MLALTILCVVIVIFLIRVSVMAKDHYDDKGPIVHLDQEAPYKIEPPDNK